METLLSETYERLLATFGKNGIAEEIKNKKYDKQVVFANKSKILAANGYVYFEEDNVKPIAMEDDSEEKNIFYAFNIADSPTLSLNILLSNFHSVLKRKDDIVIFDKELISKIKELQVDNEEINPIHITDLNIFLTQEQVASVQMNLLEQASNELAAKEKEIAEKERRIAELEALFAQSKTEQNEPKTEQNETKRSKTKPTE